MNTIYRYQFSPEIPMDKAESTLVLALIATEALHGQAQVRIATRHLFNHDKQVCVVTGSPTITRQVVLIFTQFLIHEFGENSFHVRQMDDDATLETKTEKEVSA